ncbi:MAG: SDR family oxidoreductase [Deltaproteobacteria bacterium]|nr:SDR family oxidoreductase [Deltaproteobacteria bacterium]
MSGFKWMAAGGLLLLGARVLGQRAADLRGKTALITGGSRGLGLALAQELARNGCNVAICARDARALDEARKRLEEMGAQVLAETCDVSRRDEVEAWVASACRRFGQVDILVNNASIIQVGPLETMDLVDFEQAMAVNFWGGVHATSAVLPQMRERRAGQIASITSIGGTVAVPHALPYDAAKFAMVGFSEGLRAELAKDGISVTTIIPGFMRTGSPVNALFKGKQSQEFAWFALGGVLPIVSMSAERAARRIVRAVRRREPEVTLGWQAKTLKLVHALAPSLTLRALGLVNRLLPASGARVAVRGQELLGGGGFRRVQRLLEPAARKFNQYAGQVSETGTR